MLNEERNRLLTQVGPGTPLGNLMRCYWIPVLHSSQLQPGEAPLPFTILGERFVAFRSPEGAVGVMNEACPHRGASLLLGRNEPGGLRCIYHGWKFSAQGELLEAPTHPENQDLTRLRNTCRPVHEAHGIVWTWLGEGTPPPMQKLSFSGLPNDHVVAVSVKANCGWLQPLETLWDVFHAQILHNQTNRGSRRGGVYFSQQGRSMDNGIAFDYPEMHAEPTSYGMAYMNVDAAKRTHFRFILPFFDHHALEPGEFSDKGLQISVPVDDDHSLLWMIMYNKHAPLARDGFALQSLEGAPDLVDFTAHLGPRTRENRWGQRRDLMDSGESWSGVPDTSLLLRIFVEDLMVIESQERPDRTKEDIGITDRALVLGRKRVLEAIEAVARGEPAPALTEDLSDVEAKFEVRQQPAA
ncbi:MAG: Rieske 2Fe-2S domain-containing protein [Pseudomonadota bacterium]|nr:Rieske 2Fe-2S domain-containing protein [Pseudomonadota bacterium]